MKSQILEILENGRMHVNGLHRCVVALFALLACGAADGALAERGGDGWVGRMPNLDGFAFQADGRLGIGVEGLDRATWTLAPALPALKALGIRKARIQSGWARVEKTKGVYDWSELDAEVDGLVKAGVEPWICLCYGNALYKTPAEGGEALGVRMNPLTTSEGTAAWRRWVRALVTRYRDRVHAYEVWNEPNIEVFLYVPKGKNWADEYVELTRITSEEVRSAAPDARVVVNTCDNYSCFWLFERGIGKYCDVCAFHGYEEIPERYDACVENSFYGQIRRVAPHVEFWCGEAGIPSAQPKGGQGALYWVKVDEDVQTRWMARHLARHLGDPNLSHVSYFHLYDFMHFSRKYHYYYGILRGDYSRKPVFAALQRVKAILDDGNCVPDRTITLLHPAGGDPFAVHSFLRHGEPLFAYVMPLPLNDNPAPKSVRVISILKKCEDHWRDPVVVDVIDGSVRRAKFSGREVELPLSAHLCVVTEATVLRPYMDIPARKATQDRSASGQYAGEDGKGH